MFSNNSIVSPRQMKRLLMLDLFSGTSLILPMAVGRISGLSGIFAIALGAGIAVIFALILLRVSGCYETCYPQFCREVLGIWGGRLYMAVYVIKYFTSSALLLAVFAQIVNHTFLTDIPRLLLGTALLAVCAYAVTRGIETRARLGEMLVYPVIIPIVLIIILALPQVNLQWLPGKDVLQTSGLSGFIWSVVLVFANFSVLEWLLFLRPNVKKKEGLGKKALWSVIWPALLNILILTVCIGVFSAEGMNAEHWPVVTLMQIVRFPGGFLSRQDGLMLAFWMVGMFLLISGSFHYGSECLKGIIPRYNKPWMTIFPAAAILALFFEVYAQDATRVYLRFMLFVYMPLSVLMPVFVWGIRLLKHKKIVGILICISFCGQILSGCSRMTEIEDRNFVMCLGVDVNGDDLEVSFGFPDLKALTGDGDNIHYPAVSITGKDMDEVQQIYADTSNKRLDYGQLQVIIFGRKMLEDPKKMAQVLDHIKNHQEFTRTVFACMAADTAKSIVALDESVNGSIGVYLKQLFENNQYDYRLTVGDLIIGMSRTEEIYHMAVITAKADVPEYMGTQEIKGYYMLP